MFKGHCFPKAIILQAVYFKLRFSLSYRDVEELLSIRGVKGGFYFTLMIVTAVLNKQNANKK